jgi:hypothetical protein
MFRTNSFFMGSLRSGPNMTYEVDPFGKHEVTYFSQLTACMLNKTTRVSATLDSDMNIIKMKVYNATNPKKELTGYTKEQAATLLLYQCYSPTVLLSERTRCSFCKHLHFRFIDVKDMFFTCCLQDM